MSETGSNYFGILDLLPIAISILALVISAIGLGWTVYRDTQRPKFRVSCTKRVLFGGGLSEASPPFIVVDALNVGPIPNRVGLVFARKNWWRRKILRDHSASAMIQTDYSHPATSSQEVLSSRIEVGDTASHAFPYNEESFLRECFAQVGVADGFGKIHWAPKRHVQDLRKEYLQDFKDKEAP